MNTLLHKNCSCCACHVLQACLRSCNVVCIVKQQQCRTSSVQKSEFEVGEMFWLSTLSHSFISTAVKHWNDVLCDLKGVAPFIFDCCPSIETVFKEQFVVVWITSSYKSIYLPVFNPFELLHLWEHQHSHTYLHCLIPLMTLTVYLWQTAVDAQSTS